MKRAMARGAVCGVMLLVVFASAARVHGAEIKKTNTYNGAEVGNCIFSTEELPKGEEASYKVADKLKCGEFENLYARCYFKTTVGKHSPDLVRASLLLSSLDQAMLYEYEDMAGAAGWDQMVFYILDGEDSDFRAGMRDLCVIPGSKGMETLDINLVVAAGKVVETKYEAVYDETQGKVVNREIKTYKYTPLAAGGVKAAQDKVIKGEAPAWDKVTKALAEYWTAQYDVTLVSASAPSGKPGIQGKDDFTMYRYGKTSQKIKGGEGGDQTCVVKETALKVFPDGKMEIFNLDFDYYSDCK